MSVVVVIRARGVKEEIRSRKKSSRISLLCTKTHLVCVMIFSSAHVVVKECSLVKESKEVMAMESIAPTRSLHRLHLSFPLLCSKLRATPRSVVVAELKGS